ncbi:MAG TPA: Na+/H+ antiporter NhaA [Flavisolibacter sp.]|jgi:NhaA family Na+:H+ antiporter|nr:Na+/H+ antiporter NhaA [Flavisolibacter sp.]
MELTRIFRAFFNSEKIGGLILLSCTAISLIIANSDLSASYTGFWHQPIDLSFGSVHLDHSLAHCINDGLMTIFFLLVGLEIERELFKGELSSFRNALLPIGAAIGGMAFPALIYYIFNAGHAEASGFGIPMATDIAFALGMLALAGSRVPYTLKIFLTALAIIDDLGAILVIALFYNSGIEWGNLGLAIGIFTILMIFNKLGIKNLLFYLIPGIFMWYFMLQSGIHATITGVLLAFAIPFSKNDASNPSYILQHALHKPVAFLILPLFALANTGIVIDQGWFSDLQSSNSLGIMAGLIVGKPVGILITCWLLIRLGVTSLPNRVNWKHMAGAGLLAGIGFTMSIFISNLAFTEETWIDQSKVAVLIASMVATLAGLLIFFSLKSRPDEQ